MPSVQGAQHRRKLVARVPPPLHPIAETLVYSILLHLYKVYINEESPSSTRCRLRSKKI